MRGIKLMALYSISVAFASSNHDSYNRNSARRLDKEPLPETKKSPLKVPPKEEVDSEASETLPSESITENSAAEESVTSSSSAGSESLTDSSHSRSDHKINSSISSNSSSSSSNGINSSSSSSLNTETRLPSNEQEAASNNSTINRGDNNGPILFLLCSIGSASIAIAAFSISRHRRLEKAPTHVLKGSVGRRIKLFSDQLRMVKKESVTNIKSLDKTGKGGTDKKIIEGYKMARGNGAMGIAVV